MGCGSLMFAEIGFISDLYFIFGEQAIVLFLVQG